MRIRHPTSTGCFGTTAHKFEDTPMKRMGKGRKHKGMMKGRGKGMVKTTMENPLVGKSVRGKGRKKGR